ncbi:MAG: lipoyl(octanoyl) transferase LipB [Chloroflexi bacterium]|nr:lipoyl(octanoyl) transferase LipB [Chloroflexota bacterium]
MTQDTLAKPICDVRWLGRLDYNEAWELQRDLARQRAAGDIPDTLLLLEHEPVYTTGRSDVSGNLRVSPESLGAPLVRSDRGGDITFHGPGQLVAYPIVDLKMAGLGVARYVRSLEEVVIRTLYRYGIEAALECALTGVWIGKRKIAAVGVRVGRPLGGRGAWVTTHGFALNVDVNLDWFGKIVPCGIPDREVTSIAGLIGQAPSVREVAKSISRDFAGVFDRVVPS